MQNFRSWGKSPYTAVLVHGGPGAPGEMAAIGAELGKDFSLLEPFQTKKSVKAQITELHDFIKAEAKTPVILVGWSWGAWLVYLFTAKYPELVKKLILISSGVFETKYLEEYQQTRLSHLSEIDQNRIIALEKLFKKSDLANKEELFAEYGSLFDKADSYCQIASLKKQIEDEYENPAVSLDIYNSVWPEAAAMRESGELLAAGKSITCPVVLIQGDYDAQHVNTSLREIIANIRNYSLAKCGHHPWYEKFARDKFFKILQAELTKDVSAKLIL